MITALLLAAIGYVILKLRQNSSSLPQSEGPEAREGYFQTDGFEIFYRDLGSGPAILFLHGLGASSFAWRYQTPEFSRTHRLIIPDLPGFGRSSKLINKKYDLESQSRRLLNLLNHLQLDNLTIVGSSMGGLLALSLAKEMPGRVKKLVLLAPATDPNLVPKGFYQASWAAHFVRPMITQKTIERILYTVNSNPDRIQPEVISQYYEPYKDKRAMQTFVKATHTLRFKRINELIDGLNIPTMVLYGERDQRVPRRVIDRLCNRLTNSRLHCHPNLGHHLQEDDPTWTNEKIRSFLNEPIGHH